MRRRQPAHGVGRYGAYVQGGDARDALAEAGKTGERGGAMGGIQRAVRAQAHGHAHGIAQAVDHTGFAMLVARHHHVEAVGAEVDGGEQFAFVDLRFTCRCQGEVSAAAYRGILAWAWG